MGKTSRQQDKRCHYYNAYVQEVITISLLCTKYLVHKHWNFLPCIFVYEKIMDIELAHYLTTIEVNYLRGILQLYATMKLQ